VPYKNGGRGVNEIVFSDREIRWSLEESSRGRGRKKGTLAGLRALSAIPD
jgi:hypothetical protein